MTVLDVGKAHQKIVREQKAESEGKGNRFWENLSLDLKTAIVKPVDRDVAKHIVEEYEWMGNLAAVNFFYFGIFFENVCGGVVVFGQEYIENLGRWDKYGYTGKIILLNRGVCLHWTPINTGSKLIAEAMKQLPSQYEVVTCTTDHLAGEIGTIYQACNFYYVGSMRDANPNVKSKNGDRDAWIIDGKLYGARNIRSRYGTTQIEILRMHHPNIQKVKQNSKHRYFFFRGNKYIQRQHKASIEHLLKPYPKRNSAIIQPAIQQLTSKKDVGSFDF